MDSGDIPIEWPTWTDHLKVEEHFAGNVGDSVPLGDYLPVANAAQAQRGLRTIQSSLDWRFNQERDVERREAVFGPNYQHLREVYDRQLEHV